MKDTAVYNSDGTVRMRYCLKQISGKDFEEFYSSHPDTYKLAEKISNNSGKLISAKLLFKTPVTQSFVEEQERGSLSFFCLACGGEGVIRDKNGSRICKQCDLGRMAEQFFGG